MNLALSLTGAGTPIAEIARIAEEAEASGFSTVYVTEAWRSAFVSLSAIAARTRAIGIGTYVSNVYARSPLRSGSTADSGLSRRQRAVEAFPTRSSTR